MEKAVIPGYGRKGIGWLHPRCKLCNAMYERTAFSLLDLFK